MAENPKIKLKSIIWLFVVGCFLGYILETVWYFFKHGEWINKQGLLYGPFKPIYGFGLIIIVLCMHKYQHKNFFFKFLLGVIIGSAFEYFGSLFQEYIFGTSTWNYTSFKFNIAGRIYLPYCLAWGIIAIICIDYLFPLFNKITSKIPKKVNNFCTIFISIFMIINISLTVLATIRYADRVNNVKSSNIVFKKIDEIYPNEYMQAKFPKLKVIKK